MRGPGRPSGARGGDFGAASPVSPDQSSAPVAGSVEIKVMRPCGALHQASASTSSGTGRLRSIASPMRRIAATLASNGDQSSRSAIAPRSPPPPRCASSRARRPTNKGGRAALPLAALEQFASARTARPGRLAPGPLPPRQSKKKRSIWRPRRQRPRDRAAPAPVAPRHRRAHAKPPHQRRRQRLLEVLGKALQAPTALVRRRSAAPGSRQAAPGSTGSPPAAGRRRRARHGRNRRR
jgi:hypothetical protein